MASDRHLMVPEVLRPLTRWAGLSYRRVEHSLRNVRARTQRAPVFVLGNQRSGTSAIAALLGRACGRSAAIDMLMEVSDPTIHLVASGDLSFGWYVRRNRWEFSHDIVKEPNLTFLLPQLLHRFPESRFVFIVRDPRDNIRSLLNAMAISGQLPRLEERHTRGLYRGWDLVLDGTWAGIDGGDHYIDRLASRWARCTEIYLANRDSLELCRYEDFRDDKLGELARLGEALGCPVTVDVASEVDQQYQTRGDRSVAWSEFFGSDHLARIERICADGMRACGYEPTS